MFLTPNHALPLLAANQAQKHLPHNEALLKLDAILQLSVKSRALASPPASAEDGARYLVPQGGTAAWGGTSGSIASRQTDTWRFFAPTEGWVAWIEDEQAHVVYRNGDWFPFVAPPPSNVVVEKLGVNATADLTNRFSLRGEATLLSHETADHRLTINKASQSDTASILFQTAHSGRAELGLTGSDHLSVKVSSDGTQWRSPIVVSPATGQIGIGTDSPQGTLDVNGDILARAQMPACSFLGDIDGAKWITGLGSFLLSFLSDNDHTESLPERPSANLFGRIFRPKIAFSGEGNILAVGTVRAAAFRSGGLIVNDDAIAAITPIETTGTVLLTLADSSEVPAADAAVLLAFNIGNAPQVATMAGGNLVDIADAPLTGTTGIDGRFTVAVSTSELILENRSGTQARWRYVFLG